MFPQFGPSFFEAVVNGGDGQTSQASYVFSWIAEEKMQDEVARALGDRLSSYDVVADLDQLILNVQSIQAAVGGKPSKRVEVFDLDDAQPLSGDTRQARHVHIPETHE